MIYLMRENDDIYQGHINKLKEYASDRRITQKETQGTEVPFQNHAAMIIGPRGRTLSLGRNKLKTHPIQAYWAKRLGKDHKIYLHAETDALIKAMNKHGGPESVHDTDILVVRFNRYGETVSSKPCIICRHMLQAHGLRHVFHT